jgi:uncharacterized membrane protein YGL010W
MDRFFADYAADHQTRGNQVTHVFGIPMIVVAVFAWSSRWVLIQGSGSELPASLLQLDFAELMIAGVSLRYLYLDWRVGLPFIPVLFGAYWLGRAVPNELAWILFVLGWVLQFIGHAVFEKKSPAFTKNLEHLLVGPIWIFVKFLQV